MHGCKPRRSAARALNHHRSLKLHSGYPEYSTHNQGLAVLFENPASKGEGNSESVRHTQILSQNECGTICIETTHQKARRVSSLKDQCIKSGFDLARSKQQTQLWPPNISIQAPHDVSQDMFSAGGTSLELMVTSLQSIQAAGKLPLMAQLKLPLKCKLQCDLFTWQGGVVQCTLSVVLAGGGALHLGLFEQN